MAHYFHNGIDNVACWLDLSCRQHGAPYQFLVVLELDGVPDERVLRRAGLEALNLFPLLRSRRRRSFLNGAPYQEPVPSNAQPLSLEVRDSTETEADSRLSDFLNQAGPPLEHLALSLVKIRGGRSLLAFRFDHRLFDGGGGELFVDLFGRLCGGASVPEDHLPQPEGPFLNEWKAQFSSGRTVNRQAISCRSFGQVGSLAARRNLRGGRSRFLRVRLSAEHALRMERSLAVPMLLLPHLASRFSRLLLQELERIGASFDSCVCSATIDLRRGGKPEMFFNRWAPIPFFLPRRMTDPLEAEREYVRQFYELVRIDFPRCLEKANLLTRPLPLAAAAKFLGHPFNGSPGTAVFAGIWREYCQLEEFAGCRVENLYHVPRVPPEPGLGLFVNRWRNRMNAVLSYVDGVVEESSLARLLNCFVEEA
ncbi:MAG: hypothetical protein A2X49_16480 [Lentisphaerae bacterium GWF2_52_8]|nr:MAG: hypothetical protein A2X49_16480 [Lentisphaerae bacterium GWF2_52_8]